MENIEIIKKYFHFHEIDKISPKAIKTMLPEEYQSIDHEEIQMKSNWKKYKNYTISINEKPVFFIKEVWEMGVIKELIALHIAKYFLDGELFPSTYVFGLHYPKGKKHAPVPFLLTTFEEGKPLTNKTCELYAFQLGRHYRIHEILSLYDCDLRHFLASGKTLKRIDLGLAFYHLDHRYRGFEEYMPKYLPYMRDFWRGYFMEGQRVQVMLLNTRDELAEILEVISNLRLDDLVNFRGKKLVNDLKNYWKREKIPVLNPSNSFDDI